MEALNILLAEIHCEFFVGGFRGSMSAANCIAALFGHGNNSGAAIRSAGSALNELQLFNSVQMPGDGGAIHAKKLCEIARCRFVVVLDCAENGKCCPRDTQGGKADFEVLFHGPSDARQPVARAPTDRTLIAHAF